MAFYGALCASCKIMKDHTAFTPRPSKKNGLSAKDKG
jgi:hypothetical protein